MQQISIKAKFLTILILMSISVIFSASFMYFTMGKNSSRLENLKTKQLKMMRMAEDNYRMFEQFSRNLEVAISTAEPNILIESKGIIGRLKKNFQEVAESDENLQDLLDEKLASLDKFYLLSKSTVMSSIDLTTKPGAFSESVENLRPLKERLRLNFIESRKNAEASYLGEIESLNQMTRNSIALNIGLSSCIFVFVLVFMFRIITSIMSRIDTLRHHFLNLNLSNLQELQTNENDRDEMAQLANYTNEMIRNLKISRESLVDKHVLDEIIHSMQTMLVIAGKDFKIVKINRLTNEYTGFGADELIGQDVAALFKEKVGNKVGSFRSSRSTLMTKSGEEVPIFLSYTKIRPDVTSDVMHVYNCMDMSDIVQAEEERESLWAQLNQASKLASLGTLGAGVAHELNNPLVAIRGFAYSILKKSELNEFSENSVRKIIVASERMQGIINHLREFSRSSQSDKFAKISVEQAIDDALIILEKQLSVSQIELKVERPNDLIFISGNKNQLESVIENLLTNSRDSFDGFALERSRVIKIWFTVDAGEVIIHYEDNGSGMSEETVNKIFDPFYTTKVVGKGTGLGMSITHDILKRHNGKIKVRSEIGKGTKFELFFPILNIQKRSDRNDKEIAGIDLIPDRPPLKLSYRPKVIIIDDEPEVGEVLELFLEDDFDTTFFENPVEGVAYLKDNTGYDLLITDLKMPQMSGHNVIEKVRDFNDNIAIIVSSGHAQSNSEIQTAMNLGANAALPKPYGKPDLVVSFILELIKGREA